MDHDESMNTAFESLMQHTAQDLEKGDLEEAAKAWKIIRSANPTAKNKPVGGLEEGDAQVQNIAGSPLPAVMAAQSGGQPSKAFSAMADFFSVASGDELRIYT